MSKILSIIIPRYKETAMEMFPLLTSINNQVGIDFSDINIIIVNDGPESTPLDINFLSLFNMEIMQLNLKENGGPGVARQAGLDEARSQYVMFCDADDIIHNVGVLGAFIQEMEQTDADLIKSAWLEEQKVNGKYVYINHELENTWMHGKIFRRQFLKQNNIRFHDTLRVHEDSYFLCITEAVAKNRRYIGATTYIWKWAANSITRRNNNEYTYESFPTFIQACTMAFSEVERINSSLMEFNIIQFIFYIYFTLHRPDWLLEEHRKFVVDSENVFVENIKKYWKYYTNATKERIAEIYTNERQRSFNGFIENETVDTWLKRLELL